MSKQQFDIDKFQLASVVTKNSRTGLTSNRRLLVIKRGHLYYYSTIPKSFKGDPKILESFHELPKCSIEIGNIKQVKGLQKTSSYFSIQFQAKHMMQREDIRKTITLQEFNFAPKNTSELVTWQFTCDNQYIKQRWVTALETLKAECALQKAKMQTYFDGMDKKEDEISSNGSNGYRNSVKIPWRESLIKPQTSKLSGNKPSVSAAKPQDIIKSFSALPVLPSQQSPPPSLSSNLNQTKPISNKGNPIQDAFGDMPASTSQKKQLMPSSVGDIVSNASLPMNREENLVSITQLPQSASNILQSGKNISYSDSEEDNIASIKQESVNEISADMLANNEELPLNFTQSEPIKERPPLFEEKTVTSQLTEKRLAVTESKTSENSSKGAKRTKLPIQTRKKYVTETFSRFYTFIAEATSSETNFLMRIEKQKELSNYLRSFKEAAGTMFVNYVSSLSSQKGRSVDYVVVEQWSRGLLLRKDNLLLKIALVTTQTIFVNGKPKIFFDEQAVKNLKMEFKIMQHLFTSIVEELRRDNNLRLRVPPIIYFQYKGVCCLAFETQDLEQYTTLSEAEATFSSECHFLTNLGYKTEYFNFRKYRDQFLIVSVRTKDRGQLNSDEAQKDILKRLRSVGFMEKHHNLAFEPPIDKTFLEIAAKQGASTSNQSLKTYVDKLEKVADFHGACPKQQIIEALNYCLLCKVIRKVYRSAQGEIDQTNFFNLILRKDQRMLDLIAQTSYDKALPSFKGAFFSFVEHYFGIFFDLDQTAFQHPEQQRDLLISAVVRPLIREYSLQNMQLYQSFVKLPQYLQTKNLELASKSMEIKREVYCSRVEQLSHNNDLFSFPQLAQLLFEEAVFAFIDDDYVACARKCEQYKQLFTPTSTRLLCIYLLQIKAFSKYSQKDLSDVFKLGLELILFNFGPSNSALISFFCLSGLCYCSLDLLNSNSAKVGLRLLSQAKELCEKQSGTRSQQYLNILLDFSRAYRILDRTLALRYLNDAIELYSSSPFMQISSISVPLLIYRAEIYIILGIMSECQSVIISLLSLAHTLPSHSFKRVQQLQYEFGLYSQKQEYCMTAIECLWSLGSAQRIQSLEMAYRLVMHEQGQVEPPPGAHTCCNKQKGLLSLQNKKHLFDTVKQMVEEAVNNKDQNNLSLIRCLIGLH